MARCAGAGSQALLLLVPFVVPVSVFRPCYGFGLPAVLASWLAGSRLIDTAPSRLFVLASSVSIVPVTLSVSLLLADFLSLASYCL